MVSVPAILIALLTLTSWTFAADAPRSVRKPADGKAFCTVYPSDSVSVSTTEDFVKKTVGTDGLLPSTDDSKNFVSWIAEASPAEVDMLNSNTADDAVQTFAVFPVDRKDADKCAETEKFMKDLINDDYYPHPFVYKNQTYYWTLKMTNAQRIEVAKGPGEFPNVVPDQQHLQTDLAKQLNWKSWEDHASPKAHGTCTTDKAVGAKYESKKAKLVVVQIGELGLLEINDATRKILADVTDKAGRKKKSVVSIYMTGDPADPDSDIQDLLEESLQELFALDIPVITSSGNNRKNEPDVDTGGIQVTIHAPGKDVTRVPESGSEPSTGRSGTSFATPLVAGEVANLLSYETVPFDTSDGSLVKNLKQYLAEDKASWTRVEETAIWNGVNEAHTLTVAGSGGNSGGGSGGGSSNTPPPL
ncbi:subtilisin-like protease [Seiridium cupressi]